MGVLPNKLGTLNLKCNHNSTHLLNVKYVTPIIYASPSMSNSKLSHIRLKSKSFLQAELKFWLLLILQAFVSTTKINEGIGAAECTEVETLGEV